MAAWSGAGAGAAIGGVSAALMSAGFASSEASTYENEIKQGKAVVIVHAENDSQGAIAEGILRSCSALTKAA